MRVPLFNADRGHADRIPSIGVESAGAVRACAAADRGAMRMRTRRPRSTSKEEDSMNAQPTGPNTIVLIHGLWMTPRSWEHWISRYESRGYKVLAPSWPGMEAAKVMRVIQLMGERVLPYFHAKYGRG